MKMEDMGISPWERRGIVRDNLGNIGRESKNKYKKKEKKLISFTIGLKFRQI